MRQLVSALVALSMLAGCEAADEGTRPDLTGLTLKSVTYLVNVPTRIEGTAAFADRDGDVAELRLVIVGPDNIPSDELVFPIQGVAGQQQGAVGFSLDATTTLAGRYRFVGRILDAAGNASNPVDAILDVEAGDPAPRLSNLQLPIPEEVPLDRETVLTGSVDFLAPNGRVTALIAEITANSEVVQTTRLTPTAAEVDGKVNGTLAISLPVTPTVAATHTLTITAEDADGDLSDPLRLTFVPRASATTPVLRNLDLGLNRVSVDIEATLPITFDYTDSDGDVAALEVTITGPDGEAALERTIDLDQAGNTSGDVALDVAFTAAEAGRHTLTAVLVDAAGQRSNEGRLTFDASVPSTTAPNIFDLVVDTPLATATQTSTLTGTVAWSDVDRNASSLVLEVRASGGAVLVTDSVNLGALANRGDGVTSFSLDWTPAEPGFYTFAVFVRDAEDQVSRTLTRTLQAELSQTAPELRNLGLGTSRAIVDVMSSIAGTVAFTNSNGDLATLEIIVKDAAGQTAETFSDNLSTYAGQTSGTMTFSHSITLAAPGRYTVEVRATDAAGQRSPVVTRTFDAISTPTSPSVSDLRLDPVTLYPNVGATVTGSVLFQDVDANVSRVHVEVKRPDGTSLVTRQLAQSDLGTSGLILLSFDLTPDIHGHHSVEVWAEDAVGQLSTRDARALTVTDSRPAATRFVAVYAGLFPTKASSFTVTVDYRDPNGDLEDLELRLLRPDGSVFWSDTLAVADADGQTVGQFSASVDFTPDVPGRHTLEGTLVDGAGGRSAVLETPIDVGDLADVYSACAALEVDCAGEGICYDIKESTCEYFEERLLSPPEACDDIATTNTVAECVSSTTDPASPLLTETNRCTFVQYWSWPTSFPIDCRCSNAAFDDRCKRPYETPQATTFGSGPRIRGLANTLNTWKGLVDGREMFVPVSWSTSQLQHETMIFAVNLDTGARRHFSGAWNSPVDGYTEVGSGDRFVQVMDMKKHSDGFYYAVGATSDIAPPKNWRIDPATGNRTKIFDAETAQASGLCPNDSTLPGRTTVQMTPEGWAMDAAGSFYFSNVGMPWPSVVRITLATDGSSICDYVTRIMDCPLCSVQENVDGGYSTVQFDMRAFEIVGN